MRLLKDSKVYLQKKYQISELGLFDSFANGTYTKESDIDIFVDFNKKIDGFEYIKLAHEFEDLFNHKIDLVSRGGVKEKYLPSIEKNLIHV
ncbi:nucleotidyltransferase family protein [Pedobacter segetis]|uniref:nucleotidyltransferase family protein n=1 Tax=Pedobacter segetis TaxID=2793069 RepID=UPI00293D4BA4|nr:nucleotidyltransferase domain-containing protein [Pedobacter segetis]